MGVATQPQEAFVELATAARRLGVSRSTVNGFLLEGRLPAQRVGQRWIIATADLERFAATYSADHRRGPDRLRPEITLPVIKALQEHPGATVQQLAQLVQRPRRTVLGWIQMLDAEGLVSRQRGRSQDPDRCHLTQAGQGFLLGEEATTTP